jgi:hypothetical protein
VSARVHKGELSDVPGFCDSPECWCAAPPDSCECCGALTGLIEVLYEIPDPENGPTGEVESGLFCPRCREKSCYFGLCMRGEPDCQPRRAR